MCKKTELMSYLKMQLGLTDIEIAEKLDVSKISSLMTSSNRISGQWYTPEITKQLHETALYANGTKLDIVTKVLHDNKTIGLTAEKMLKNALNNDILTNRIFGYDIYTDKNFVEFKKSFNGLISKLKQAGLIIIEITSDFTETVTSISIKTNTVKTEKQKTKVIYSITLDEYPKFDTDIDSDIKEIDTDIETPITETIETEISETPVKLTKKQIAKLKKDALKKHK